MGCKYSKKTDEYEEYECTITDGACLYMTPDKKRCIEDGYIDPEE